MDSLFRLRQLLWSIAAAAVLLLPAFSDAFARTYQFGTATGAFPADIDGVSCSTGGGASCARIYGRPSHVSVCASPSGSDVLIVPELGYYAENPTLAPSGIAEYSYCNTHCGYGVDRVSVNCADVANQTLVARTWAVCPAGSPDTATWRTTITGGTPGGGLSWDSSVDPPIAICKDGCVFNFSDIAETVAIRPGEYAVGDDMWLSLSGTLSGSLCYPGSGVADATTLPVTACDPLSGACGGTTDPGTGTGGTGIHDAAIAGNTAAIEAALNQLRTSSDLATTGSYSNCSEAYTCSGDPLRCAQLTALRTAYCLDKDISVELENSLKDYGSAMLTDTPETMQGQLREGMGEQDFSKAFTGPRWLSSGSCPDSVSFSVLGVSHSVGFSAFCQLAPIFSFVLVAGAALVAGRIFAGGLI